MAIDGKQITRRNGYTRLSKVQVDKETRVIKMTQIQPITKDTIDKLVALRTLNRSGWWLVAGASAE